MARLDPLLQLRKRTEEARARALAVSIDEHQAAARALADLRAATQASRHAVVAAGLEGSPGGHVLLAALLAEQARLLALAQADRVQAARSRESAARLAVITAAQQRRAVERVLELRRAEARREHEANEQRRIDDVATTRAARSRAPRRVP